MRILIVDDSKAMRSIVRRLVGQAGFTDAEILEAEDGQEAFDTITSNRPDVVLSDWNMPIMTGIELLETLRAAGNDVPLGFITSESSADFKDRAFDAGAAFMIAKPFTADDFVRILTPFS
ncbi:MAG: response regulator [Actinomycetota bacterium]|nr:response regulator [Actinomycetota bacterium]